MQVFAIDLAGPWYLNQVQTEVLRFVDNQGQVHESWEDFKQFWPLKPHVNRHDGMIGFNLGKVCSKDFRLKWAVSFRWSSSLYCPARNSNLNVHL